MDKLTYRITCRIFAGEKAFGPGVAELLHRVEQLHSLRSAANSMEMAYSKAWTIIRNSENTLGFKLLSSTVGGKNGGGAVLTDEAREFLGCYEEFCTELKAYGDKLFAEKFGG